MPTRKNRLRVTLNRRVAMELHRAALGGSRLVYVIVQDKKIRYATGRSRVAYVGTTKMGASRIAHSAAYRARQILGQRGVESFHVRIITSQPRQHVVTWRRLERALLLTFRDMYGEPPICNVHGVRMKETDEFDYFSRARLRRILEDLA